MMAALLAAHWVLEKVVQLALTKAAKSDLQTAGSLAEPSVWRLVDRMVDSKVGSRAARSDRMRAGSMVVTLVAHWVDRRVAQRAYGRAAMSVDHLVEMLAVRKEWMLAGK